MAKKSKTKKIPMRMCVGCRERFPKKNLTRIVRTKEEGILLDKTGKLSGRGAYICNNNNECLNKAIKTKALERNLEISVSEDDYNTIVKEMIINE